MVTRSKKFKRFLYITMFIICILSFLFTVVALIGSTTLNSLSNYVDPGFLESSGYASFEAFMADKGLFFSISASEIERHLKFWVVGAIAGAVLAIMSLIYLIAAVGVRDENGVIQLSKFDRLPGEIQLAGIVCVFFFGGGYFLNLVDDVVASVYGNYNTYNIAVESAFAVILGIVSAALGLALIMSNAKKVKADHWMDNTLLVWLWDKGYNEFYKGGSMMKKVMLLLIAGCLLSATRILAPLVIIVILAMVPKWVHQYDKIQHGVDEVNSGNLQYKIPLEGDGELDELAEGINRITESANLAVENEVRNQRMKTDLITNVSHDLKTPLTSMVTYIDLLKHEGLDSENADLYLDILHQKTERLCQLTEDLFEAAKASSGTMPVEMANVDMLSLLNQGLGEMNERIEASSLEFVISHPEERWLVMADGRLLWRVMSNLLSNVLKYSQDHTRVYVDFYKSDNLVTMEMKNISRQSLNIEPEVLMERFKRGDESRTVEGSGLGLTIAKDLMRLMGGEIGLSIDGDLFKVKVSLKGADVLEPAAGEIQEGNLVADGEANL